jgi:lactocepin
MNMKKVFISLVVLLLVFSGIATGAGATINKNLLDSKVEKDKKIVKTLSQESVHHYQPDDQVRVIVELKHEPALFTAQSMGKTYAELSESAKKKLRKDALSSQELAKGELKKASISMKYLESFTTVVNGFSGEVPFKSVEVIENLPSVEGVHITHKYERPTEEPEMLYSKELVKAQQTWQDYGYKGGGMTVAVIDTGIDPSHRDMVLSEETEPELTETEVQSLITEKDLVGKYFTEKVPYAYNYADQNNTILDLGPDASMHGMHVAGTVGANGDESDGGIKGVAPEAQILGMKVFGNDPAMPFTYSDIYVKAIDEAIILGADVINMSLGSTASFVLPEDPEQKAVERAVENGVLMAISAGNSAKFGEGFADPLASNPDIGLVGSPGLSNDSLQVASFENKYLDLDGFNVLVDGEEKEPVAFLSASNVAPESLGEGNHELVYAGLGRMPGDSEVDPEANDFEDINVEGKIALIQRGESAFVDKVINAQQEGAIGVIIFNNASGYVSMATTPEIKVPQLFVLKQYGDALRDQLLEGNKVEISFQGEKVKSLNPENGKMSTFTSWGVTPNLDFKPEITAPGGNILSTLQDDSYGLMSGTSMAAPHVAGGSALMMQRVDELFDLTGSERVSMAKNILMNTSNPQIDKGLYNNHYQMGIPYSPRRQGAGLMDLHAAMATPVVATEKETGVAKVALKEIEDKATFTLKLDNFSDESVLYSAKGTVQTDAVNGGSNIGETQGIYKAGTISEESPFGGEFPIEITSKNGSDVKGDYQVLVPANDSVEVTVSVDLTDTIDWFNNAPLSELFENGYFVEGFVTFTDVNDVNPPLAVPYVGFNGEWDDAPVLDGTIYDEESFYEAGGLLTPDGSDYRYLGTNDLSDDAYGDKVAFSPNGDRVSETVLPVLSFLRNAKNAEFSILNKDKEKLTTLRKEKELRKHYYDSGAADYYTVFGNAKWDGKVKGNVVEDGLYYYEIATVVDYPNAEWQSTQIPVYVDTKKPAVEASFDGDAGKVSWNVSDEGVGVSHIDVLVNGESVLAQPLAADIAEYQLEEVKDVSNVKVIAYDWAGNTGVGAVNESDDSTIPFVTAVTPEALGYYNTKVIPVQGYVNDDSTVEELYVNGNKVALTWDSANNRYSFDTHVEFTSDGVKDIKFVGVDESGNEISFLRKVIVDTTSPEIEVDAPFFTNESSVELNVDITDNFSEMRFYIDGSEVYYNEFREPYVMEETTKSVSEAVSLSDGNNSFELKVVDIAGNETVKNISVVKTDKKAKAFSDVKDTFWAKDAIQTLNVQGVINGYDTGAFGINDEITRLQAAQMIVRDLGLETEDRPAVSFSDVNKGDYGYDVIAAIADEGIMTGDTQGKFNPKAKLTRAEMAKIVVEAYGLKGSSKAGFSDVKDSHWAKDYINTLIVNEITQGYPDHTFKAGKNTTRSEFAMFLVRTKDDRFKN